MKIQKLFKKNPFVIFLMGPTAIGKTSLAIKMRQYIPVELISVDSMLVYKYMNIGTAKPNDQELAKVPHRLVNIKDPSEYYTVANFYHDVLREISHILSIGKIPMLVGGTMLYYKVLLHGLSDLPTKNIALRKFFLKEKEEKGSFFLYQKLHLLDPITAYKLHPNDFQRISRALEVCILSQTPLSQLLQLQHFNKFPYHVFQFAIVSSSKDLLFNKIKSRFQKMLDLGFQKEVQLLINRGDLTLTLPSINSLGYRQMWLYLHGKISYTDMMNQTIAATKKLVKHQITWLRNWKNLVYLTYDNEENIINHILKHIMQKY